MKLEKIKQN